MQNCGELSGPSYHVSVNHWQHRTTQEKKTCAGNLHVSAVVVCGISVRKHENVKTARRMQKIGLERKNAETRKRENGDISTKSQERDSYIWDGKSEMFKGENMQRHMIFSGSSGAPMQNSHLPLQWVTQRKIAWYLSIFLALYIRTYYLPIHPSIHPSIYACSSLPHSLSCHLSVYLSIDRSIRISIYPSAYHLSSAYLSTYLPTYLSIYLSIHPSIHPSIFSFFPWYCISLPLSLVSSFPALFFHPIYLSYI